ncbi:MAG: chloride channel protein [Polyangiaceae bacterium]
MPDSSALPERREPQPARETAERGAARDSESDPRSGTPQSRFRYGLGLIGVAVAAAGFAIVFRASLAWLNRALFGASDVVAAISSLKPWQRALMPAVGAFLGGFLSRLVTSSGGVGDVMEAVVLGRVRLSMRSTLLKSSASWLAIASGGSLGREGPLIQFGGAAGQRLGTALRLPLTQTRILIAAGTAAGFAAAYNTPFAAVLFVLEVVIGVVVLEAFWPLLIATVLATSITRAVAGPGPIYGEHSFAMTSRWELLAFAGLGLVVAIGAQCFMRLLSWGEHTFKRLPWSKPFRVALGGLMAGAVIAFLPEVSGNGYEPLNRLLDGEFSVTFVLMLLIGKMLATTSSVSSGSPGGVFTPTLLVGGAIGFMVATGLVDAGWLPPSAVGGYTLVGMAAATAATTHAPLLAAVMAFELSGDYAIVLPLLLATALSAAFSRRLRAQSIYTAELSDGGAEWQLTLSGRRGSVNDG